jgi:hypothetical protein
MVPWYVPGCSPAAFTVAVRNTPDVTVNQARGAEVAAVAVHEKPPLIPTDCDCGGPPCWTEKYSAAGEALSPYSAVDTLKDTPTVIEGGVAPGAWTVMLPW